MGFLSGILNVGFVEKYGLNVQFVQYDVKNCQCIFFLETLSLDYCEKHQISSDAAQDYEYSLLQKCAKSTCIIKNTILIDRIMKARMTLAKNMYLSKNNSN